MNILADTWHLLREGHLIIIPSFILCISDATVYVGGLDEKVSEPLLWELFLQAGPVVNTHMPKDRVTGQHQGEFQVLFYKLVMNQVRNM